jgi:hypothetical protein
MRYHDDFRVAFNFMLRDVTRVTTLFSYCGEKSKYKNGLGNAHPALCSSSII